MPKLTRRGLIQMALAGGAAGPVKAQAPAASENARKLAAVKVPKSTEPAFTFKA